MSRLKLEFPSQSQFSTVLEVRAADLNYGNHLGNDRFLAYAQEARLKFLQHLGYKSELEIEGIGTIMGDAAVVFKNQAFLGDQIEVFIAVGELTRVSFELYYRLIRQSDQKEIGVVKTGIVCFDYLNTQKVCNLPEPLKLKLQI
ncbi:MAG: thioesterase family protein [Bacteroidota bacterium]